MSVLGKLIDLLFLRGLRLKRELAEMDRQYGERQEREREREQRNSSGGIFGAVPMFGKSFDQRGPVEFGPYHAELIDENHPAVIERGYRKQALGWNSYENYDGDDGDRDDGM